MSFVKIWVHAVWGTKNREKLLTHDLKTKIVQHIIDNSKRKDIYIDSINGYYDHIHCLLAMNADMPISKIIQLIKGESAHWINKSGLLKSKFEWANEYFAISVSESVVDKVRKYIAGQEEHHRFKSFVEEYNIFMKKYGFIGHD